MCVVPTAPGDPALNFGCATLPGAEPGQLCPFSAATPLPSNGRAGGGIVVLLNRSFGLIKNHQGSKGEVSQEPGLAGGQCCALSRDAGGEESAAVPGTVLNHFCSYFWVVRSTRASHLCAGTSLVFAGRAPSKGTLPWAGVPGLCSDTTMGTWGQPGSEEERETALCKFYMKRKGKHTSDPILSLCLSDVKSDVKSGATSHPAVEGTPLPIITP